MKGFRNDWFTFSYPPHKLALLSLTPGAKEGLSRFCLWYLCAVQYLTRTFWLDFCCLELAFIALHLHVASEMYSLKPLI